MQAPPPMESKREALHVKPELTAIVTRALAKKPDQRFADAREMLAALEAVPAPAAWIDSSRPSIVGAPLPPPSVLPPPAMAMPAAAPVGPPANNNTGLIIGLVVAVIVLFVVVAAAGGAIYFLR